MTTLNDRLAAYFKARPNQWLGARELGRVAGFAGWRTRTSNLRKPPYSMVIENRVKTIRNSREIVAGQSRHFKVSEYRWVPPTPPLFRDITEAQTETR